MRLEKPNNSTQPRRRIGLSRLKVEAYLVVLPLAYTELHHSPPKFAFVRGRPPPKLWLRWRQVEIAILSL